VALDARTGKVVWDQTVADNTLGYRYTSGPIVAKGKIIAIGGTQYIAVTGGNRGTLGGAALYTFAMPASPRGALR
jgi:outer membrane protein assembly factor BamB